MTMNCARRPANLHIRAQQYHQEAADDGGPQSGFAAAARWRWQMPWPAAVPPRPRERRPQVGQCAAVVVAAQGVRRRNGRRKDMQATPGGERGGQGDHIVGGLQGAVCAVGLAGGVLRIMGRSSVKSPIGGNCRQPVANTTPVVRLWKDPCV